MSKTTTIKLPIPGWAQGRRIVVLAGIEEIAHKEPGGPWLVKTERCSRTGECCGACPDLKHDGGEALCGRGYAMPVCCAATDGRGRIPGCTVRWREL